MRQLHNNKQYACPEEILYTICLAAWAFCRRFLVNFTSFMANYSNDYIDAAIAKVNTAKALTAIKERNSERKRSRIKLVTSAGLNLKNWQGLKRFITSVFPQAQLETYLSEAGASFYAKASAGNWTSVRSLLVAMKNFMSKYDSELATKMPAPVRDQYNNAIADCFTNYDAYFIIDREINMQTAEKNAANNEIYKAVIAMLKDGQQIFKSDKAMKKQFTFSYLLKTARGSGISGFKGYIASENGLPLEGVIVTNSNNKYSATTAQDGRFHITKMEAAENYIFTFSKDGYQTLEKSITVKPGITHNVDLMLRKEVMLKAA